MPRPTRQPIFLAECDYGRLGCAFREVDRDSNSRAAIVDMIASGEINVVKVLQVIEPCDELPYGGAMDVTDEVIQSAIQKLVNSNPETGEEWARIALLEEQVAGRRAA